ncbi:MAG: right-handed parallel beta-helix repeat-containing protein, partial [Verrucomicrobiae bacterium]|nr:right-handed parallel beta-helix repeat-containing protein [Verrucomicrobiae bacterium]
DCYEDPRVSDSIITYNKAAGLYIQACHDIVVNGNHFEEDWDAVKCVDSFNLCMNGNNIDDHLGNGVVIENTYGSVVSGNMIEECNGTAIVLDRDCYGITLSANVIAHELEGGIDLRDAHGCAVSANTFTLVHRFSVRLGPDSGRINISGNSFGNSEVGGGTLIRKLEHENPMQIDMGTGVLIEGASHVNVSGNTFSGLLLGAVKATGDIRGVLVTGNVITDWNRSQTAGVEAISIPASDKNRVGDNLID